MTQERLALELDKHINRVQARIDKIAEHEINNSILAPKRNRRLGALFGQWKETVTPASGKDKCDYVTRHFAHCSSPWRKLQQLSLSAGCYWACAQRKQG